MKKRNTHVLATLFVLAAVTTAPIPVFSETEPNDTIANANVVQLNTSEQGVLTRHVPADIYDCYQFTLPNDGLFQLGVVPVADLDVWVQLLDTDGVSLLGSKNDTRKGGTEGIVYVNLRAGTYFAIVGLADGAGDYGATFNFAPVAEVDAEPNDGALQASPLDPKGEAEGHLGYHGSLYTDIYDYYEVAISEDGKLEVTVFPDQDLNVAFSLHDGPKGTYQLVREDSKGKGQSEKFVYNNLAAGTYRVLVHRTEGYGSYTLASIYAEFADPNDAEPNDTPNQAVDIPLTVNAENASLYEGSAEGRLGFFGNQYRDDRDFYKITTPAYGNLSLSYTKGAGDNLNAGYTVFDENIRRITSTGNDSLTLNGLVPGIYYVVFYREERYGGYTLSCTLEQQEPPAPFTGPAIDFPLNGTVSDVALDESAPNRYFKIILPEDGKLVIRSQYTDGINATTRLYHADGTSQIGSVGFWYTTAEQSITAPDLRKGTYIVRGERHGDAGLGTYTSEFTPVTKIDDEPNDMWEDLSPFAVLNDSIVDLTISGHIGYGGNGWRDVVDYYLLDIRDDGAISVTATGSDTMYYHIGLYAWHGSTYDRLDSKDPWYTTAEHTVGKANILPGKYLLYVFRHGGYGSYDLKVNFTPNRSNDPEPNDQVHQAVPITVGQGVIGHIGYQRPFYTDPADWYTVDLPADGSFAAIIQGDPTMYYGIHLYNSDLTWRIDAKDPWYTNAVHSVGHNHLKAGTYYILVERHTGYGTYHLYTVFQEQQKKDPEPNHLRSMSVPLNLEDVVHGAIGYQTAYELDSVDCYSVNVPSAGRYKLNYQTDPSLNSLIEVFASNMFTRLRGDGRYYRSDLYTWETDLEAATYYIQCSRDREFGAYTLRFGDVDGTAVGSSSGMVTGSNNFPLFEVTVKIIDRETKTDFAGKYSFANLQPGIHKVTFSSGAKYYTLVKQVEIRAGEETVLDVTLFDSNKSAPYDPEHLYGIPNDRYIHLFWSPSESPDVADGGGYKLYIDNQEPMDLGNVCFYRSDGFENGRTYNCRVTVYDKFGNESDGETVQVTPSGLRPPATPTPTIPPEATPTPTTPPEATPTPTIPIPPVPSPTLTPTQPIPTPSPTLVPVQLEPLRVFDFDSADEFDEFPGGFIGAAAGWVSVGEIPGSVEGLTDGQGATISVGPDAVELLMFPTVGVGEHVALLRLSVQATGPGADIALAALDGSMDGSIGTAIPKSDTFQGAYKRLVLVFDPPGTTIIPVFQLANMGGTSEVQVYLDQLEIYLIPRELGPLARLIYGE